MENKKVVFNVIMPCYNSEKYVITALDSIVNQTYPHWHLTAINDGSTDKTLEFLEKYAEKDKRITVLSKENGGYVSAVNYGLDHLNGDYFLFLGSDDYLSTELFFEIEKKLSLMVELPDCIAFKTAVCYGDYIKTDFFTKFDTLAFKENTTIKEYSEENPAHSDIFFVKDTSKCFKCDLLKDLRYFGKFGIDADGIFSMLFCNNAKSFLSVPFHGYYWTIREGSVSSSSTKSIEKEFDKLDNWQKFFNELEKMDISDISPKEIEYLAFAHGQLCELILDFGVVCKYSKIIKKHIRWVISKEKRFSFEGSRNFQFKMFLISPVLSSIFYKLYKRIK